MVVLDNSCSSKRIDTMVYKKSEYTNGSIDLFN